MLAVTKRATMMIFSKIKTW